MILYKTKQSEIVRVNGGSNGQSLKKYATTITGDGVKTVFTIKHNLDAEDILFEMNDEDGLIFADYNIADNNTVNIVFSIAPSAEDNYSVIIYGINGTNNGTTGGDNSDNNDDSSSTSPVTSGVSGIKGSAEIEYRTGDVTISPTDIGLGNVDNTPDNEKNVNSATNDSDGNKIVDTYAKKIIYGNDFISLGRKSGTTVGVKSVACGIDVEASGDYSHAQGWFTKASGNYSHAEGVYTNAIGMGSHAENGFTKAIERFSHASGYKTIAKGENNFACGTCNVEKDVLFSIGNGSYNSSNAVLIRHNAFSVNYDGMVKAQSTITASTTADYAEFFEWDDRNPDKEDRVGKFVTLNREKISIATSNEDYILGIVSGQPFVLGNGDCDTWNGIYLKDDFNRTIYEKVPKTTLQKNKNGEIIKKKVVDENGDIVYEMRPKLNPDYDSSQVYVSRFDRPEWSPVGMLGVLSVWQDGTLKVNKYCCCNSEGIATSCDEDTKNSYRVIRIISDKVAKVILK